MAHARLKSMARLLPSKLTLPKNRGWLISLCCSHDMMVAGQSKAGHVGKCSPIGFSCQQRDNAPQGFLTGSVRHCHTPFVQAGFWQIFAVISALINRWLPQRPKALDQFHEYFLANGTPHGTQAYGPECGNLDLTPALKAFELHF